MVVLNFEIFITLTACTETNRKKQIVITVRARIVQIL